jgi:hypothetical protein
VEPPRIVAEAAVNVPGLLPGVKVPPDARVNAPTDPEPFKRPPLTWTFPAVPPTSKVPPFTVVLLEEIDPPEATFKVPSLTVVAPL